MSIDKYLSFLKCPEVDRARIEQILPRDLKEDFEDKAIGLEFYRWIQDPFFERPGFLYDELWTSTFLGLSLDGFKKVESKFNEALYSGIFSGQGHKRWWKSSLMTILSSYSENYMLPWEMGRRLLPGRDDLYSKCVVSEEPYPETVGQEDSSISSDWIPIKMKYTLPHPNFESMLYFEDLRIMNPDYEDK